MKTYDNVESHARGKEDLGRQRTIALRIITKKVSQHAVDRLQSEDCEDGRHAESHARQEWGLDMQRTTILMVVPKVNSTQRTDFSLRAVKIDGSAGSRAGAKISPKCMTYVYADRHQ